MIEVESTKQRIPLFTKLADAFKWLRQGGVVPEKEFLPSIAERVIMPKRDAVERAIEISVIHTLQTFGVQWNDVPARDKETIVKKYKQLAGAISRQIHHG